MRATWLAAVVLVVAWLVVIVRGHCMLHGIEGSTDSTLYHNTTVLDINFDTTTVCPMLGKNVTRGCCTLAQYKLLRTQLMVMEKSFKGCPACNYAMRAIWCQFSCGLNQSDYVVMGELERNENGEKIIDLTMNISQSLGDRLWASCRNAVMGQFYVRAMFPTGVKGFMSVFTEHSPKTRDNHYLIQEIYIDNNPLHNVTGNTPMDVPTIEHNFTCSAPGDFIPIENTYPMPLAQVGSLSLQYFVAIVLGALLIMTASVALLNRREGAELTEEENSLIKPSHYDIEGEEKNGHPSSR